MRVGFAVLGCGNGLSIDMDALFGAGIKSRLAAPDR
jgi:hypothetical protein